MMYQKPLSIQYMESDELHPFRIRTGMTLLVTPGRTGLALLSLMDYYKNRLLKLGIVHKDVGSP